MLVYTVQKELIPLCSFFVYAKFEKYIYQSCKTRWNHKWIWFQKNSVPHSDLPNGYGHVESRYVFFSRRVGSGSCLQFWSGILQYIIRQDGRKSLKLYVVPNKQTKPYAAEQILREKRLLRTNFLLYFFNILLFRLLK